MPNMNFGGIIGATTVGENGAAQYSAWDRNRIPGGQQNGGRPNPRPNNSPGGMPGQGPGGGGRPGPRGGGGPRRNPRGQNSPGGMPTGMQNGMQDPYANFPAPQEAPPGFLPMTPQFEAGRRGLEDQFLNQQQQLMNQRNLIDPLYQQQLTRMQTQEGQDFNALKEQLAARGIYSNAEGTQGTPGGVGGQLYNRDIQIPYGRGYSDLATGAAGQYAENAADLTGLNLGYNQSMAELLLNRAADAAQNMPMNVPQFSTGSRILRGQAYNNQPRPTRPNKRNQKRNNRGKK